MSVRYILQPNGTYLRAQTPIDGIPFFSDWLVALLARHAAHLISKKGDIDTETGLPKQHIIPLDRNQAQAAHLFPNGTVGVYCLGCGCPTQQMLMSRIRIGALVQFAETLPVDERFGSNRVSAVRKWKPRVVGKMGLGCPACTSRYLDEVNRTSQENSEREGYIECLRAVYIERGDYESAQKVQPAKVHTAFLDVLTGSIPMYQLSEAQQRNL